MAKSISRARHLYNAFKDVVRPKFEMHDHVGITATWKLQTFRALPEGGWLSEAERVVGPNQMTADGLNALASRGVADTTSPFGFISIGTVTAVGTLGSDTIGEVDSNVAAVAAGSNEVLVMVATFAGDTDGITSLDLRTAAANNHVNSGSGILLNSINSVDTILADSDFLRVQIEVQVGSHNL